MDFKKMRSIRKAKHISQDQLAMRLGINRATVSKYETGAIEPSLTQLTKIADALGVRLEDLVGLETFDSGAAFDARWKEITGQAADTTVTRTHKANGEILIIDHPREQLLEIYDNLDADDQKQLIKHGKLLLSQLKYQDDLPQEE